MSESVVLCEGFHDRAFWDGWLTALGCNNEGFKPGTAGFPAQDPWGDPVRGGQFAFRSRTGCFVRIRPCNGKANVLKEARIRLQGRATKRLVRLVINVDVDTSTTAASSGPTGIKQSDVLHQVQQIDPAAGINPEDEIDLDGGATKVSLVRWETSDGPTPGVPDQQTLERLVCAALAAVYPDRAVAVHNWLQSRPIPPHIDPKEHSWSYMAGWYAQFGCEAFYSNLWNDPTVASALETRLRASGAWGIGEALST